MCRLHGTTYRHSVNEILIGTYTCPTQQWHFEWPWVILSDLAKYSMTRSARGLSATAELLVNYRDNRLRAATLDAFAFLVAHHCGLFDYCELTTSERSCCITFFRLAVPSWWFTPGASFELKFRGAEPRRQRRRIEAPRGWCLGRGQIFEVLVWK